MADENRGVTEEMRQQRHESRTNQTFWAFIRDLCDAGDFKDEVEAIRAAAVVLTRLEQRLTGEEAQDLNAQLPMKVVEILHEAKRPEHGGPVANFHKDDFVQAICNDLNLDAQNAEALIRAVFTTVRSKISEGEADDVYSQLPKDMRPLWERPI